jgi:CubicO group peptidase (beta-lactamase class C family)
MITRTLILLIAAFTLLQCTLQSQQPAKPLAEDISKLPSHFDSLMHAYAHYGRFSGTMLIGHTDDMLYNGSFGYAHAEQKIPNTLHSVFNIGSVSKQFTAAAILKLAQEKKLNIDDKLSEYFPDLGPLAQKITLHHLLTMSSGIMEDFSRTKTYNLDEIVFPKATPVEIYDLVHYFGPLTEYFKPGKQFDYSNINYIILAAVVEKVSMMGYHEYLKTQLWEPLGMKNIAFGKYNHPGTENVATGYTGLPLRHSLPEDWHDSWQIGAGGIYASAPDLLTWMKALTSYQVLDSVHTQKLFKKHMKEGYGYGWQMCTRHGNPYIYHEGGTLGYISEIGFYPQLDVYVVLLTNHIHGLWDINKTVKQMQETAREVHNILFDQPFRTLPVPEAEKGISELASAYNLEGYHYDFIPGQLIQITASQPGSPSILDLVYHRDLKSNTKGYSSAVKIARALGEDDFRYLGKKSDLMLKAFIASGKISTIWQELTGDKGAFISANMYRLPCEKFPNCYWIRLVHEKKEIGVFITMNSSNRMQGMHIDQSFSFNGPDTLWAIPINNNHLFIDGFRYGHSDVHIVKENEKWLIKVPAGDIEMVKSL